MERKIGEIFEYNGEWYQCFEEKTCTCFGCNFRDYNCNDISLRRVKGSCQSERRTDNKSVIFKKLEKVGEPTERDRTFQCLKALKTECVGCVFLDSKKSCDKDHYIDGPCHNDEIWVEIKQNKEDMEEYKMHDAKEDIPEFDKVVDECLFGENKLNLKPFNLQKAKEGKSVCTRDGRKVRIICFDREFIYEGQNYCILALINDGSHGESVYSYTEDGLFSPNKIHNSDLMMLSEKKEGWINVYRLNTCYKTKEEAEANIDRDYEDEYVRTVKINWEE